MSSADLFTQKVLFGLQSLGFDVEKVCMFLQRYSGFIVGRFCADAITGTDGSLDKYSKKVEEEAKKDGITVDFTALPYKEHIHIVVVDCKDIFAMEKEFEEITKECSHPTHLIKTKEPIRKFVSSALFSFQTCYFDGISIEGDYVYLTSKKIGYVLKKREDPVIEEFYIDKDYSILPAEKL